jgi:hypothetical protein
MSTLTRGALGSKTPPKGKLIFHNQDGHMLPAKERSTIVPKAAKKPTRKNTPTTRNEHIVLRDGI